MLDRRGLRAVAVLLGLLLGAVACGSSSSLSSPGFSDPCVAKPQGGALCIKVYADGGTVRDVIGYLSSKESPLGGKRWRLLLSAYPCDPGTKPAPACAPAKSYPANAHRGKPTLESTCRRADGDTDSTSPGCHNTLNSEYASQGDWTLFPLGDKGFRVRQRTWLCVSEQIASAGRWVAPPPQLSPDPLRACSAVEAA
jgi:hypothetical protein